MIPTNGRRLFSIFIHTSTRLVRLTLGYFCEIKIAFVFYHRKLMTDKNGLYLRTESFSREIIDGDKCNGASRDSIRKLLTVLQLPLHKLCNSKCVQAAALTQIIINSLEKSPTKSTKSYANDVWHWLRGLLQQQHTNNSAL